jgi:hypothetical protein
MQGPWRFGPQIGAMFDPIAGPSTAEQLSNGAQLSAIADLMVQMRDMLKRLENGVDKAGREVSQVKAMVNGLNVWLDGFEVATSAFAPAAAISTTTADNDALGSMEDVADVDHQ